LNRKFGEKVWAVREWLNSLMREDRKVIGEDIKTAQFGWPLGMPLIRKMETGVWEIRSRSSQGIAWVFFTVEAHTMVLLHGFIKKSRKTPQNELRDFWGHIRMALV
jgi:phage-related protein